jgi:FAD/FMN-containing dehydrogenase
MMYRAFGLFGDHIRSFEIITANSEKVVVTQDSNPELFFAVLGGCPGNFGALTHVTIEPHRDSDHWYLLIRQRSTRQTT